MTPDDAQTRALVAALRRLAPRAAALLARGVSARAAVRSAWCERADAHAASVDDVLDTTCHRLGGRAPEHDCADAWMRRVHDDVRSEHRDAAERWGDALSTLLAACTAEAVALARARLDARTPAPARAAVLERLAHLAAALDESAAQWCLPLVRLPPLAALPDAVWDALGRAPAWAVVRALAQTAATDDAYRRAVATLAHRPGAWAAPRVRDAAQRVRRGRVGDTDPERLAALLAQWRWPAVDPPLATVGAWAETARTRLSEDAWAAGVHHAASAADALIERWPSAEAYARAVERLAPRLRASIDDGFERRAVAHVAHWLSGPVWTDAERAVSLAHARVVLARMRTLWAADPALAPRSPAAHALRLVATEAQSLFPDDPEDTRERLRPARVLAWRVPCTSPERAITANHGLATLDPTLAHRAAFDVAVGHPDAPMAHTYATDPATPERDRRERAVMALLARLAFEPGP